MQQHYPLITPTSNSHTMEDDREMRPDEAMIVDSGEREHRRGVLEGDGMELARRQERD